MNESIKYHIDNLKIILIFFVVLGHFLNPINSSSTIEGINYVIYCFHMPLFIFVSGYLSKGMYSNNTFRYDKLFSILKCYVLYRIIIWCIQIALSSSSHAVDFFTEDGAGWYLFSLVFWYLMIPLVKNLDSKFVIFISIALSIFVGFQNSVGDVFCMSRSIVFAPFFFIGYYANEDFYKGLLETRRIYKYFIILLSVAIAYIIIAYHEHFENLLYLVYGNKSYFTLGDDLIYGPLVRVALMLIAVLFSVCLIIICPNKKYKFTFIGRRTLCIYILHLPIRNIIKYTGIFDIIDFGDQTAIKLIALCMIAVLLILFLSTDIIDKYFKKIFMTKRVTKYVK